MHRAPVVSARPRPGWLFSSVVLAAALWGCDAPQADVSGSLHESSSHALSTERVVLDTRATARGEVVGRIAGTMEPVPPSSDAYRTIVLEEVPDALPSLLGQRVLDATLVDDGALIIGADRVLRLVTPDDTVELATEVLGPLSATDEAVAFVYGEPPDLWLARADLRTGKTETLAPDLAPAWSPAISSDGREVLFSATYEGRPTLMHVDANGEVRPVASQQRAPAGPVAPVWIGDRLVFQDDWGVVVLDLSSGRILEELVDAALLPDDGSGRVRVVYGGETRTVELEGTSR